MLAGFVGLAALGLLKPGPVAAFVGAGIGIAHVRVGKTTMTLGRPNSGRRQTDCSSS